MHGVHMLSIGVVRRLLEMVIGKRLRVWVLKVVWLVLEVLPIPCWLKELHRAEFPDLQDQGSNPAAGKPNLDRATSKPDGVCTKPRCCRLKGGRVDQLHQVGTDQPRRDGQESWRVGETSVNIQAQARRYAAGNETAAATATVLSDG